MANRSRSQCRDRYIDEQGVAGIERPKYIDLRSDTTTRPTKEMRLAMATAEVGDDSYGDDPTVNRLQQLAAAIIGKEEALYLPSGVMANEIAVMAWTQRGDEIIGETDCHIIANESPSPAILAQVVSRPLASVRGAMDPEEVRRTIRKPHPRAPRTAMITIENTHNASGGCVVPVDNVKAISEVGKAAGVPLHLDGARIFNAAVAAGADVKDWTQHADSVMFCLSKGLCAPVGSMLAGSHDFIMTAKRCRKIVGGGMKQAGIIAAAGIVGLEKMVGRLGDDHRRARELAIGLVKMPCVELDIDTVQTNMVRFRVTGKQSAHEVMARMRERGVLFNAEGAGIRLVTHNDIDDEGVATALAAFADVLAGA